MLYAKAWNAQVKEILHARHERGEKLGLRLVSAGEVPQGTLCFLPDAPVSSEFTEEHLWELIKGEPLFMASYDSTAFLLFRQCGDLVLPIDVSDGSNENWHVGDPENPEYDPRKDHDPDVCAGWAAVVIDDLHTPLHDGRPPTKTTAATPAKPQQANKPEVFLL